MNSSLPIPTLAPVLSVVLVASAIGNSPCYAAEPLRVGDEVEFDFGDLPLSGTVVDSRGNGRVLKIKVFFKGEGRVFTRFGNQVRKAGGEPDNVPEPERPSRTWTDATGAFTVEAKLIEHDGTTVQLEKADGSAIPVPIARLSAKDRQYLEQVDGTGDTSPGDQPAGALLQMPATTVMESGSAVAMSAVETPNPVAADPAPYSISLPSPVVMQLPQASSMLVDRSIPLLVDGKNGRLAYSSSRGKDGKPETKLTLVDLETRQMRATGQWDSHKLRLVAADPVRGRAIALTDFDNSGHVGSMVLISAISTSRPAAARRWELPRGNQGNLPKVRRAFLTASIAIVQLEASVHAWDVDAQRERWRIEPAGGALAAITAGGRHLAVQRGDLVGVFKVATGDQLGSIKLGNAFPAGLAFSPDGTGLIVGHHANVKVYDLRNWTVESEMKLWKDPPHAYGASAWVDDRHVLLAGGLLIRPADHLVLWNYGGVDRTRERFATLPYGFHACFHKSGRRSTLIAATLPHATVPAPDTSGPRPDLALQTGETVTVRLETGGAPIDASAMQSAAESMIRRSGWRPGAGGNVELNVTLTRAEEREVEYQRLYGGGPSQETVKFAPWKTSLALVRDGETLWDYEYTPGSPRNVTSKTKSTQEIVRAKEVPDPDFFDRIILLPHITAPKYQDGYGRSVFDAAGITDQAVTQ